MSYYVEENYSIRYPVNRIKVRPLFFKRKNFFVSHIKCVSGYLSDNDNLINFNYVLNQLSLLESLANVEEKYELFQIRTRVLNFFSKPLTKPRIIILSNALLEIVKLSTKINNRK